AVRLRVRVRTRQGAEHRRIAGVARPRTAAEHAADRIAARDHACRPGSARACGTGRAARAEIARELRDELIGYTDTLRRQLLREPLIEHRGVLLAVVRIE